MRDLFGEEVEAVDDGAPVTVPLVLHRETARAWLLAEGRDRREGRWVPRSEVTRGEGRDENQWTMPRWMAVDRGWL